MSSEEPALDGVEAGQFEPLVRWIRSRRLEAPAIFVLESCKPMRGLLQQFSMGFEPLLRALLGPEVTRSCLQALESPVYVELLIRTIEKPH